MELKINQLEREYQSNIHEFLYLKDEVFPFKHNKKSSQCIYKLCLKEDRLFHLIIIIKRKKRERKKAVLIS